MKMILSAALRAADGNFTKGTLFKRRRPPGAALLAGPLRRQTLILAFLLAAKQGHDFETKGPRSHNKRRGEAAPLGEAWGWH